MLKNILLSVILSFSFINLFAIKYEKYLCKGDSVKIGIKNVPQSFNGQGSILLITWNGVPVSQNQLEKWVKPVRDTLYVLRIQRNSNIRIDSFSIFVGNFVVDSIPSHLLENFVVKGKYSDIYFTNKFSKQFKIAKINNDTSRFRKFINDTIVPITLINNYGCKFDTLAKISAISPLILTLNKPQELNNSKSRTGIVAIDTILNRFNIKHITVKEVKTPLRLIQTNIEIFKKDSQEVLKNALLQIPEIVSKCQTKNDSGYFASYRNVSAPGLHPNDFIGTYTSPPHNLAAMRMPEVWSSTTTGSYVGIIEIGGYPNIYHEDLYNKVISISMGGIPTTEYSQHATRVAGVVSAQAGNSKGVAGIGYNAVSICTAIESGLNEADFNTNFSEILNFYYTSQVRIVSMSFASANNYIPSVQELINDYTQLGMVFIAAAGNSPGEINNYPASYDNVISVSGCATDNVSGSNPSSFIPGPNFSPTNQLNDYTVNFNNIVFEPCEQTYSTKVDICAPSKKIPTTGGNTVDPHLINQYIDGHGTSYAAPAVAAVVSLLLNKVPCLLPEDIEHILKTTARPIADNIPGKPFYQKLGAGFIDAKAALDYAMNYHLNTLIVENGQEINLEDINRSFNLIKVKFGGILKINNSIIRMQPNSEILIEAGGKLLGSNSIIKLNSNFGCNLNQTWKGITILGNSNFVNSDLTKHGFLNLSDCEISGAINCIQARAGRMTISNTKFEVIKNGIYFYPYSKPSLSRIYRSEFNFPVEIPIIPSSTSAHTQVGIKVEHINSLRVLGCKFIGGLLFEDFIKLYSFQIDFSKRVSIGIQTFNSSVSIMKDKQIMQQTETNNLFSMLSYGIQSTSLYPTRQVNIANSIFYDCAKSIYSNGAYINAKENEFQIRWETAFLQTGEGLKRKLQILLYNSPFSTIQGNTFKYIETTPGKLGNPSSEETKCPMGVFGPYYLGILSNNSNPRIESNNFINAFRNIQLEGDNELTPVYCNNHNRHLDAITVFGLPSVYFGECGKLELDPNNKFINTFQYGDLTSYAPPFNSKNYDYLSSKLNTLRPNKTIDLNFKVNIIPDCRGIDFPIRNCTYNNNNYFINLKNDFSILELKRNLLKNGSNVNLIHDLIFVNNQNAYQVFDNLLSKSPYLSDSVLKIFIEKSSYFNDSQIFQIAIANSKLNPEILNQFLGLATFEPTSTNYNLLIESQNQQFPVGEVIRNEIKQLEQKVYLNLNLVLDSLINTYNFDTILAGDQLLVDTILSYINIYSKEVFPEYSRSLLYLSLNQLDSFNNISTRIHNPIELTALYNSIELLNNSINRLNDTLWISPTLFINSLSIISDTNNVLSSFNSGLFNFYIDSNYYRLPWHRPNLINGKRKFTGHSNQKNDNNIKVLVSPNPNSGSFVLTSNNKSLYNAKAKVIESSGKEIPFNHTFDLKSNSIIFKAKEKLATQIVYLILEFEDKTFRTIKIVINEN